MVITDLQLYLVSVEMCRCHEGACLCVHLCAYATSVPAYLHTVHTLNAQLYASVCLSASYHLCWCDDAIRPIKLTGESHPAVHSLDVN